MGKQLPILACSPWANKAGRVQNAEKNIEKARKVVFRFQLTYN